MKMWNFIISKITDAEFMMKFHAILTVFFLILTFPSAFWWSESVPFLVALSVWALIASHLAGFQAAHGEKSEQSGLDNEDLDAKLDEVRQQNEVIIEQNNKIIDLQSRGLTNQNRLLD